MSFFFWLQRKTELQQQLLSSPSDAHRDRLESELAEIKKEITETISIIQTYEAIISKQRDVTDREKANRKIGMHNILLKQCQGVHMGSIPMTVHAVTLNQGDSQIDYQCGAEEGFVYVLGTYMKVNSLLLKWCSPTLTFCKENSVQLMPSQTKLPAF